MAEEGMPKPQPSAPELDAWRELNTLLLRSAVDQAVYCGKADVDEFRRHAHEAMDALDMRAPASQILIAAGALAQSITHYNNQTQQQVNALTGQSKSLVQAFVEHLAELHGDAECHETLQRLREGLQQDNSAAVHRTVEQCLGELKKFALDKRRQSREREDRLQDRVTILEQSTPLASTSTASAASSGNADPCTGLPFRTEGEAAIRRVVGGEKQCYIAVFYLHRMALTNARFGEAIGNQVILFASQHVATAVTKNNDLLFRWTGPAFVAILEREESLLTVSNEVQRAISSPISRFFETPSRSVYLPIKITGDVIPMENLGYPEVADKIERFILGASGNYAGD